jgi:hypothetical protein
VPPEFKCSKGLHTVRLRDDRLWTRALCQKCKTSVDPWRIKRLSYFVRRLLKKAEREAIPDEIRFANLRWRIDKLAKAAWESSETLGDDFFLVSPSSLDGLTRHEIVRAYLDHARKIATGLPIPQRVPDIKSKVSNDSAGTFGATQGWPIINLAVDLPSLAAVRAVLAHEVCHYILNAAGLREDDSLDNEKLTDLSMFVLGLGHVFLSGYRTLGNSEEYRPGHRMGYLTDAEYAFASRYVMTARHDNTIKLPSRIELLRSRIITRVGEKAHERLLTAARFKQPHSTEAEIYESVYDSLAR